MSDQYKGPIRQGFAWWDAAGADLPMGLFTDFNEKFKAWEMRRGLRSEEDENVPPKPLRGSALSSKIASEERKKALLKFAKKHAVKKKKDTKFAPDIVGKVFATQNNAQRKIKQFIEQNILDIPSDYEFKIKKLDWGKYEITGSRALTPNKKSRKLVPA